MVAMMDGSQLEATVAALEAAACLVLPVALETTPAMGRTEGVMAYVPSTTVAIVVETGKELSLVLPSEGRRPPTRDSPHSGG